MEDPRTVSEVHQSHSGPGGAVSARWEEHFFSVKFNVQLIHHRCVYSCLPSPRTGFAEINLDLICRPNKRRAKIFFFIISLWSFEAIEPKVFLTALDFCGHV